MCEGCRAKHEKILAVYRFYDIMCMDKIGMDVGNMFRTIEGMRPFEDEVYLSSPTMHGEELEYVRDAYVQNWVSTVGENINEVERIAAKKVGAKCAVALATGTAAIHMAVKCAGVKPGDKVFCSDVTFAATVNPIIYEGAIPIFIDSESDTWNMDPKALEKAFKLYPDVKVIVVVHLYGTPCKMDEIRAIAKRHNAIIIEDAAESFGATYMGSKINNSAKSEFVKRQTGIWGDFGCISFNGNKIITGSSGGMFFTNDAKEAERVRKWSTQSREPAPWYQHEELGYNYRMSNIIAGVVRGQLYHLEEHIAQKKAIYMRYKEAFEDLPVRMNPYDAAECEPNFWLSCLLIDKDAMCKQIREAQAVSYIKQNGKTCPTEILESLAQYNAEGRPIWKPMHMQPIFADNPFVTVENVGEDIFERGLCLPSDNKMTVEKQDKIIEIVRSCFR